MKSCAKLSIVLLLNEKIICKRDFNSKSISTKIIDTYKLRTIIGNVVKLIQNHLVKQSIKHIWNRYDANPFKIQPQPFKKKEEVFMLELFFNSKVIVLGQFQADCYPPEIRYKVDIRPILGNIISLLK